MDLRPQFVVVRPVIEAQSRERRRRDRPRLRATQIAAVLALIVAALAAGPAATTSHASAACDTPGTPTTTVYLPNVTKTLGGPNGWVTPFIVQNVGVTATTLEVSLYRFADGSLQTCRKVLALQPATSFADVPNDDADLPDDAQFSVVVRSFGAPVVSVVNEQQGSGVRAEALSYVGLSAGARQVFLPYVADQVDGWVTTIVVQDLGSAPAAVSARFQGPERTAAVTLTPPSDPAGRSSSIRASSRRSRRERRAVTITSDQLIGAVANSHRDDPAVAAPMAFNYNGIASSGTRTYLPYVARESDGIGRPSRIVVQNAGTADATDAHVHRIRRDHGNDRERSRAAPTGRLVVYLPNVTRTLGGSSGWTTPIVLQSAGATSATIRWYRFADGALVRTQSVSGLSAGTSSRIDPRSVSGLAESTQYAVVADGIGGYLVGVVSELNFEGGTTLVTAPRSSTRPAVPIGYPPAPAGNAGSSRRGRQPDAAARRYFVPVPLKFSGPRVQNDPALCVITSV